MNCKKQAKHQQSQGAARSYAARAREFRVERATLKKWHEVEGVDIWDDAALAERIKKKAGGDMESSERELRRRKLAAEVRKKEAEADEAERKSIPVADCQAAFVKSFSVFRSSVMRLEADLPPMLAGLDEVEIQKRVRGEVDGILRAVADSESALWKGGA